MKTLIKLPILAILFLCLSLWSCEKEESSFTEISGQVYEYGTNQPIPYAKVRFEWWDPAVYGAAKHLVDSTTADENGRYYLAGDIPDDQEYYVIAKAPKYFKTKRVEQLLPNVKRGIKQQTNLGLYSYAWVKVKVRKVDQYNFITINPIIGSSRGFQAVSDTTFLAGPTLGNKEVHLTTFKYLLNQRTVERIHFNTIGFDTVEIKIDF